MEKFTLAMGIFSFVENIETLPAILFVLGLALLFVEAFLPGFGVAGGTGLLLLIVGIVLTAESAFEAIVMIVILLLLVAAVLFIILRSAKRGRLSRILVLRSSANRESGFSATEDYSAMVGKEGVALTTLRPAGTAEFDGQRLDVVSEGAFIEKGEKVRITRSEGRRIIVQPLK